MTDHPHLYCYPFWPSLYMNQVSENLYSDQWPYKTNIYLVNAIWLPAQLEQKQDKIKFIRFKLPVDDIKLPIEDNQYLVEGILSDLVPSYNSIRFISNRFSSFASSNMHVIVKQTESRLLIPVMSTIWKHVLKITPQWYPQSKYCQTCLTLK